MTLHITKESSVNELELGVRASNLIHNLGVFTIGELTSFSEDELLSCDGVGQKTVSEISNELKRVGIELSGLDSDENAIRVDELNLKRKTSEDIPKKYDSHAVHGLLARIRNAEWKIEKWRKEVERHRSSYFALPNV